MVWRTNRSRNILGTSGTGLIPDYVSDSSESEFVEEEKPWPPGTAGDRTGRSKRRAPARFPRPHSHLFRSNGRRLGNKHARRWENSMFLSTLHEIPEEEKMEGFTIVPPHSSPLTRLHTDDKSMQIWNSFTTRPEDEQQRLLTMASLRSDGVRGERREGEQCYRRIDRQIRSLLQHNKHVPLALLQDLDEALKFSFSIDHNCIVVFIQSSPFHRLLLHGVCQYLDLRSNTDRCHDVALVVVECNKNEFISPQVTLSEFLHQRNQCLK